MERPVSSVRPLLLAAGAGAAVSLSAGVYGRLHAPTGQAIVDFGFPSVISMKAWLATGAFVLAMGQLTSALWMWGRLPWVGTKPTWLPTLHRWSGATAFLLTLPVAYHCLWALGFEDTDARVLTHSILGCAFYGAFTTKLLVLRSDRLPGWALPLVGGTVVALLTGLWLTSSLWYFSSVGFPGL
jgi:hypothetical protein